MRGRCRVSVALAVALVVGLAVGLAFSAAASSQTEAPAAFEIRRTTDGIPHVRASTWRGLGIGYGQAQAEDALCTLAEAFVTYRGQRSLYFGAEGRPATRSTFGSPPNIDLDFFFKTFAGPDEIAALKREQPAELNALIAGFAEGYNFHLRALRQHSRGPIFKPACADAPWVRPIAPDDVYRRMVAAGLAGGYAQFVSEIVNAKPSPAVPATPPAASDQLSLAQRLGIHVGDARGIGSNVMAFGQAASGERGGVLFGNPHWYWGGPDRFYQAQLTLPGRMDVAGVSFLGIPVIMIGFNHDVAWSHTVSAARRFGLFELALDPADPTRHLVDGVSEPMQTQTLAVEVRGPGGAGNDVETVRRTLYRSRFGPMIDLGARHPALAWGQGKALAIRDINADNRRIFRNFFRWGQARSLEEFMAIQKQEAAMPWVNTAAVGRGDGRAWYADIGAVPGVPDALRAACATPLAKLFVALDPATPVLDGSRSACDWQPGGMAVAQLPSLLREDYVANMNDSYWLTNPAEPLSGFAAILGGTARPLSMRGREGHRIAAELAGAGAGSARELAHRVMQMTLEARSYTADRFKQPLLDRLCAPVLPGAAMSAAASPGAAMPAPDVQSACEVLRRWPNRAEAHDRGALLWDAFWARLLQIPPANLYTQPFSVQAPLHTPDGITAEDPRVAQALADAVDDLRRQAVPLDAPLGTRRFVRSDGRQLPLFGGCDAEGYFTVACPDEGEHTMNQRSHGNSYLQVVYFDDQGVQAHTLLAHGQRETAVMNGPGGAPVARYAEKRWLRFPFREADIKAALRRRPGPR